jgi:hypothetical protein
MFLFLKKESAHAQASWDASVVPKPSQRHCNCPPYCAMKRITARGSAKAEYATIDCDEMTIPMASNRNIATIVTIAIAPTIIAHDAHEDKQAMQRPHATINLIFGALVSRESARRRKWGATSATSRQESKSGNCSARSTTTTKQSHNNRAQRELAICRDRNAKINLIFFGAGLKREHPDAMWERH